MQHIVIVGGGAGGLELASKLGRTWGKRGFARITLIDRNRTHVWKPLLHEVATGSLDGDTDGVFYYAHAKRHHYRFQIGCMDGLDAAARQISLAPLYDNDGQQVLPARTISYDTLVLAVGSVSNDFNTPGVQQHCYLLDSFQQAERFHQALLNQFLHMSQQNSDRPLKLAIVGGGATGVELAAELHHVAQVMTMYGMPGATAQRLQITLLEAGERILPALPARIAASAHQALDTLGISVRCATRISAADPQGFTTADGGRIDADLSVWAAGVKAPTFIQNLAGFETNRNGQILVKPSLQSTRDEQIFVIGDCCACQQADGSWVPPRAQSAHQMATQVLINLKRQAKGKPLQPYHYKDYGSLVNLSRYSTVGSLMGNLTSGSMFIEGWLARLVYIGLYRMHQAAIHGWLGMLAVMLAQKIGNSVHPKMKLH